eukprot:TRINITY_DN18489_c0_g1_i1.p1 TRINITY_DN18489_c0_g1~~TRINITY_DN18489_c0_g1_i1.p1  ORF type:complete len:950 (-),score=192.25 TRINITY_DN18489_c0_g1_i1:63-2912(-)
MVVRWIVNKITFPAPSTSYSLASHPELFFVPYPGTSQSSSSRSAPGVPCMLYAHPTGSPLLIVHAHSNGCDIADMKHTLQRISEELHVHVMSFEYPGYGLHRGSSSMRTIDEAANAVLQFLLYDLGINPGQVVWYGRSIGSGPAIRLAHRMTKELHMKPGGLVLQCGFAKFPEVAGHLFGRVARRLVTTLWPNEAMVKEITCPVLIVHGRKDTMIPIEQSEKLWNAVESKELSKFSPCDCGHNDFNFRQCTLKPLYQFLSGVISAPGYPNGNFKMEVSDSHRARTIHIPQLRDLIKPRHFRRSDLEGWTRDILGLSGGSASSRNGGAGLTVEAAQPEKEATPTSTAPSATSGATTGGSSDVIATPAAAAAAEGSGAPAVAAGAGAYVSGRESTKSGSSAVAKAEEAARAKEKQAEKKKKKKEDLPPPDICKMPMVDDIVQAFQAPAGILRMTALRMDAFLARMQERIEDIEDLELRSVEEIVQLVQVEFWDQEPCLTAWEEVDLPRGDRVRLRVGPFSIDNYGVVAYEPGLPGRSNASTVVVAAGAGESASTATTTSEQRLRVPLKAFCPTVAQFRIMTEWLLLNSARLRQIRQDGVPRRCGCWCGCRNTSRCLWKGRRFAPKGLPERGAFATTYAAIFTNWVERSKDLKGLLARFVRLNEDPVTVLRQRQIRLKSLSSLQLNIALERRLFPPDATAERHDLPGEALREQSTTTTPRAPASKEEEEVRWPIPAKKFSSLARSALFGEAGQPGEKLAKFYEGLWPASEAPAGRNAASTAALTPLTPSQLARAELPSLEELLPCGQVSAASVAGGRRPSGNSSVSLTSDASAARQGSEQDLDWKAAVLLCHRARQSGTHGSSSAFGIQEPGGGNDKPMLAPITTEVDTALSAAMRAFCTCSTSGSWRVAKARASEGGASAPPPPVAASEAPVAPPPPREAPEIELQGIVPG